MLRDVLPLSVAKRVGKMLISFVPVNFDQICMVSVQDGEVSFVVLDAREEKYFARKHNASCTDACELLMFKEDEPEEPYAVPGRRFAEEIQVDCYKHLLPVATWLALIFSYFLTSHPKALRIHGAMGGHGVWAHHGPSFSETCVNVDF
jgi:hypothetical protein